MNYNNELWKPVANYEENYLISRTGNIISLNYNKTGKPKQLKPYISNDKYYRVKMTKNKMQRTVLLHRLVAETFLNKQHFKSLPGEDREKINLQRLEVNHIDGNKLNNCIENLEWCTRAYNVKHAFDNGLKKRPNMAYGNKPKKVLCKKDGNIVKIYDSISKAEKDCFSRPKIILCCQGKRKRHKGYEWSYLNE